MVAAKYHEFEVDLPFGQAISQVRRIMGKPLYYLHNQAGGVGWVVRLVEGRVKIRVTDPKAATWLKLKL